MVNQKLLDIITQQLKRGVSKGQIKNSLLSSGYQEQDIVEALNFLSSQIEPIIQNNDKTLNSSTPQPSSPQLSTSLKITLGIATFWPIFYASTPILVFFSWLFIFSIHGDGPSITSGLLSSLINLIHIFLYPTIILIFVLLFIYIENVYKNEKVPQNKRVMWILILIFLSFITMPIYWYRYICNESKQDSLPRYKFRYIYIPILYFIVFLIMPIILIVTEIFTSVQGANLVKKRESLINDPLIKTYMPTVLGSEWKITSNTLSSDNGLREVEYFQGNYVGDHKKITIEEIKNPKTDLKCNNETYTEIDGIFPQYSDEPLSNELWWLPLPKERWMESCKELSISGEKSVLYEIEQPNDRYFLMIFDKGGTRILLYYKHRLKYSLVNTEGLSKNDIIRIAESLRPINPTDFKL